MATRSRKILMGCGAGCLGLVVLSIGACVSFQLWINQPGALLEPTRLLGRDTTGYVEWTLRQEDPGSEAFIESLMDLQQRVNAQNPDRVPTWFTAILQSRHEKNSRKAVRQLMPAVVAWTIRPGDEANRDLHLFTLSMESLGNRSRFVDLTLRYTLGLKHSVVHGDERIFSVDEGAMFIRDNSFFITNSLENARLIVDRLGAEVWDAERDPTPLELSVTGLGEAPLHGAIGNARGELARVFEGLSSQDMDDATLAIWSAVESATLSGGFAGQTAFELAVDLQGPDRAWAVDNAGVFGNVLREGLGLDDSPTILAAEAQGDVIRVRFRVDDVFAFLDEM